MDSSLRLLMLLYLENTLNTNEKKRVEEILESKQQIKLSSILRQGHSHPSFLLWMTLVVTLLAVILAPMSLVYRILLVIIVVVAFAMSYYIYFCSFIRQLQRSIPEGTIEICPGTHVKLPALLAETTEKYQHFLITKDIPARVQVGEVVPDKLLDI